MKVNFKKIYKEMAIASMTLMLATSCTDYLDKSPDSDISPTDAYKDFQNFQGFTEEIYNCIPSFDTDYYSNSWNWGEDEIMNVGIDFHLGYRIDQGDFWGWQAENDGWQAGWLDRTTFGTESNNRFNKSLWQGAWYGIRKCNMGLENINLMTDCTQEERNLILGQLYFFRGWFHFELMQYFGGLPYINHVISPTEQFSEPRLSYQVLADSVANDLQRAADLLPIDWDDTKVGQNTLGKNQLRITKVAALAYLGKIYLWAGSPLMNKESTGVSEYNKVYCQKAAETLGELISLVEGGNTQYGLLDYSEISNNFYTIDQGGKLPGQSSDGTVTEAILRGPFFDHWNNTNWGQSKQYGTFMLNDASVASLPTANYVNYYGMANGLPLNDPKSGFDKEHPWRGRDPRFYNDIIYDGVRVVKKGLTEEADKPYQYADLQTDGLFRDVEKGSRTGYLLYKFIDKTCNKYDDGYAYPHCFTIHLPWMRLAEVYLLYAEAATEAYSSVQGKSNNCNMTAIEAVNKIRRRAGVADVNSKYSASIDSFMGEVRRERAVELAYEGHRFNDLRRWLLLDKAPYNIKTSQEFLRVGKNNTDDPTQNMVSGWSEKTILTRDFSEKHYWLPLKKKDCQIYPEFKQNPGWE